MCRWLTFALLVAMGVAGCNVENQDQWLVVVVQPDVGSDLAVDDTVTRTAKAAAYDRSTSPSTSSTSEPARFQWVSANPGVATVSDRGVVRAIAPGETQIEVTFAGQHGGRTGSATFRVVVPADSLSLVVQHDTVAAGDTVRAAVAAKDGQGRQVKGVLIQLYSDQQLMPGTFVIGAQRPYLQQSQTLRAERRIVVAAP